MGGTWVGGYIVMLGVPGCVLHVAC